MFTLKTIERFWGRMVNDSKKECSALGGTKLGTFTDGIYQEIIVIRRSVPHRETLKTLVQDEFALGLCYVIKSSEYWGG